MAANTTWTEAELAYFAGIVDGEGCLSLHRAIRKRRSQRDSYSAQLIVANTDARVIQWCHTRFGGTVAIRAHRTKATHKPLWTLTLGRQAMDAVLPAIQPYLLLKREQVELLLEFSASVAPVGTNHRMSDEVRERRKEIQSRLLALNRRGVA